MFIHKKPAPCGFFYVGKNSWAELGALLIIPLPKWSIIYKEWLTILLLMTTIYTSLRSIAKSLLALTAVACLVACSSGGGRPTTSPDSGGGRVLSETQIKAPVSRAAVDFYVNANGVMAGIFSEPGVSRYNGLFNGLYRSVDGGVSWEFLDASRIYRQVFVHPDGDVFALTDNKLWRYSVAGVWEDITPPNSLFFLVASYSRLGMFPGGALFLKGDTRNAGYMYYSTTKGSGGGAWKTMKNPTNKLSAGTDYYDFMIADSTRLLVKYGDDVYLSSTDDEGFGKVYDFATHGFNVSRMSYGSDDHIYLMDGKLAWSSSDGGLSYQSIQPYVASADEAIGFANIESFGGNLYYHSSSSVGWGSRYLPYVSADGGQSWSVLANVTHLLDSRSYAGKLYFLSSRLGVLEAMTDGRLLSLGPRPELSRYKSQVSSIASDNAGRILAVANNELVRSGDDGATWEVVKSDSLNEHILVAADNTLVVVGGQDYFAFSYDGGTSWTEQRNTRAGLSGINTIREIYESNGRLYVSAYEDYRDPVTDIFICREPYLGVIEAYDASLMTWQALSQPLGAFHQRGAELQAIQACPGEYLQGRQLTSHDYMRSVDNGVSWSASTYGDYLGGFYSPTNTASRAFFTLNTEVLNIDGADYRLANVAGEDGVYVSGFNALGHYVYVNYTTGAMYRSVDSF